ncbi:hypothetical protein [Aequorivita marina]|uniref:hypothetical protein n=1 Tax=Aequorivita marina TaxID=3073654 RepID=UPI0028741882|nr:hypothetical protein [Aequorivita sp. S2608]MDS1297831.1 hypothetical protein [Aequorivita sp. S2608]
MSQQNKENVEKNTAGLNAENSTSKPEHTPTEPHPETTPEVEVAEKKSFSERWKTNRFWLVRGTYHVLRSVWMAVMLIGGFIIWLISFLFI